MKKFIFILSFLITSSFLFAYEIPENVQVFVDGKDTNYIIVNDNYRFYLELAEHREEPRLDIYIKTPLVDNYHINCIELDFEGEYTFNYDLISYGITKIVDIQGDLMRLEFDKTFFNFTDVSDLYKVIEKNRNFKLLFKQEEFWGEPKSENVIEYPDFSKDLFNILNLYRNIVLEKIGA